MKYLAAFLATACFVNAAKLLGVAPAAAKALETNRSAVRWLHDSKLDDLDKEQLLRNASLTLMGSFLLITVRCATAVAVSLLPLLVFEVCGLAHLRDVTQVLTSWPGIILGSIITLAYLFKEERCVPKVTRFWIK